MSKDPTFLIAGCGYLGMALASLLREHGIQPVCLTRSSEGASRLSSEGWTARAVDITSTDACSTLAQEFPTLQTMVHCAASGRGAGETEYAAVYDGGCKNLLNAYPQAQLLFTSSTSVYPQIDGSIVSEESSANPSRTTGKILRQAESRVLAEDGIVLRLAGIYGPARSVLLRNFLNGQASIDVRSTPPLTPDGRWINQIHRDDAAAAILHLAQLPTSLTAAEIFNVSDSRPLTQREVYRELSHTFSRPLPPEADPTENRKRGWSHKQVSNAKLLATGWTPRYPDFFTALPNIQEISAP